MTSRLRVLVIGHDHVAGLGHLGADLRARGCELSVRQVVPKDRFDRPDVDFEFPDPSGWDMVVTTGAPWPRHLTKTWWPREIEFLRRAHDRGLRILGICFGGQLLAEALGGGVRRLAEARIGWSDITSHEPGIDRGPWFQWHSEQIVAPADATVLATSADGCEAFASGRAVSVQFHPEMSTGLLDRWLTIPSLRDGLPSADELRRQTVALDNAALRQRVSRFADLLLDHGS